MACWIDTGGFLASRQIARRVANKSPQSVIEGGGPPPPFCLQRMADSSGWRAVQVLESSTCPPWTFSMLFFESALRATSAPTLSPVVNVTLSLFFEYHSCLVLSRHLSF